MLAQYGVSIRLMFRPMTRNSDAFIGDMQKGTFMLWFEAVEGSAEGLVLDKPMYRYEHELISDAYIIYYPDHLDELRLEYFEALRQFYSARETPIAG